MDPGTIIAVVTLLTQCSKKLYDFIRDSRDVDDRLQALKRQVDGLVGVLQTLGDLAARENVQNQLGQHNQLWKSVEEAIAACSETAHALTATLSKIDASRSSGRPQSKLFKEARLTKKQDDIDRLLSYLQTRSFNLQLALGLVQLHVSKSTSDVVSQELAPRLARIEAMMAVINKGLGVRGSPQIAQLSQEEASDQVQLDDTTRLLQRTATDILSDSNIATRTAMDQQTLDHTSYASGKRILDHVAPAQSVSGNQSGERAGDMPLRRDLPSDRTEISEPEKNSFHVSQPYSGFQWLCSQTFNHQRQVLSVAFSPDGTQFVSGSIDDHSIKFWNVSTGPTVAIQAHPNYITAVAFSMYGRQILNGSVDNSLRLWDSTTGENCRVYNGHTSTVTSVAFSPSGSLIASGSVDNSVRLWYTTTGATLSVLKGHDDNVWSVAFSISGAQVISGSKDKTLRLWDVTTGQCCNILEGHTAAVYQVAFSPDGKRIGSCSGDRTVRIWETTSYRTTMVLVGHMGPVNCIAFSSDNAYIVSGSDDEEIGVWELTTGRCHQTLKGHTDTVRGLSFSPTENKIVSASHDRTVRLWTLVKKAI